MENIDKEFQRSLSSFIDENDLIIFNLLQDKVCKIRHCNFIEDFFYFLSDYYSTLCDFFELCIYFYNNLPKCFLESIFINEVITFLESYLHGD